MRVVRLCLAVFHCGLTADPKRYIVGPPLPSRNPSLDGNLVSYIDPETRNVAVRQLQNEENTHPVSFSRSREMAYVIQAREVACSVFDRAENSGQQ